VPIFKTEQQEATRCATHIFIKQKRYADLAIQHPLDEDLVQTIFRTVIDEVIKNHQVLENNGLE
jgi:chorismate mutase